MSSEPFVTAEETTNPGRGMWVMLTTLSVKSPDTGLISAYRFIVTTSTGYRAELPACICDRVVCLKTHDAHGHCHYGWHIERARVFAADVAASYGSAERRQTTLTGLKAHPKRVKAMGIKAWAEDPYAMALEGRVAE